ncbi:uncharacterized protein LOC120205064 [Hibiscus syriacus]|uniref:uncharacterized protein LOC120205064 n=1 Tax=Hibiscus syriacus TaxID=106335 RepID=UPI0019246839|nr:uncharacterized protein LOC120205064 [Hibiscus syriacus]
MEMHLFHEHPLVFVEDQSNEGEKAYCSACGDVISDPCFSCAFYNYHLHNNCALAPHTISSHPLHPQHSGFFLRERPRPGNRINIFCARPKLIVEDKSRHQHPFTLYWRQGSFICDACDTEGNYMSYICSTCSITVHKDCISLPRIIKFSRHDHCLFHKYFLEIQELTRKDCKICFNEVNLERGSYSCMKSGCNYIVHVNCALEDERFYVVVERESQCEELYGSSAESTQSSITRVVEVSEDGKPQRLNISAMKVIAWC